jgi:hypothetical protein
MHEEKDEALGFGSKMRRFRRERVGRDGLSGQFLGEQAGEAQHTESAGCIPK